ncbi:MAG: oligosaccharide flippase family protein [Clostridiales bacterium]|nr:oligosaccharide flippase family protein [Clostridiales bacterium]
MRKILGGISGAVATVGIFSVFTKILSFVFKIYLSRTLGAEAIGQYQIATSVFFLFASLSSSGLPLVLSRKISEDYALKKNKSYSLFTTAFIIGLTISLFTIFFLWIFHKRLNFLFSDPLAYPLFLIMMPALLSTFIYSIIRGYLWGKKEFTTISITETIEEVLRIVFSVAFIGGAIGAISGAYAIAIAFAISDGIIGIILVVIFFAKGGKIDKPSKFKDILIPSIPVTSMRIFASLIGTLIAIILPIRLLTAGMSTSEATATYGRITGMANPFLLAPNAIISSLAIVLIPEMSASGAKKAYSQLNKQLNSGINFSLLVSGLFMIPFIALGKEMTTLLFNDRISGQYLEYAAFMMLPMCINQLTQSALNATGKEYKAFINYIIGNLLMIAGIYFLPKYLGIYSVCVATMLCLLVNSSLNVIVLKKYTGFSYDFAKYLLKVLLFVLLGAFFTESINRLLYHKLGIFANILSGLFGIAMYIGLAFATRLVDVKGFLKLKRA